MEDRREPSSNAGKGEVVAPMGRVIEWWPDLTFPPINLWNVPRTDNDNKTV